MKKRLFKIFTFLVVVLLAIKVQAQELKFPESFKVDTTLLKGMELAEIPQDAKANFGIKKNPGLITDPLKTKGLLMSGKLQNVQSVYFEIYKDLVSEKMCFGFEVAKFKSVTEMDEILPKTSRLSASVILLTIKNYLIIIYGPPSTNLGERLDNFTKYFQQKLGAKLVQDRRKDLATAVTENYVTNLPPPLPPEPEGNYTSIAIGDLDNRIAKTDGLAYMRTKKREKLAPGKYRASSVAPAFESLVFTIDQDSLLHGDYEYHYAEDYSKSPSKESKLTYDHGVLTSEIVYKKGNLLGSTSFTPSVVKEGNDYLITIKTTTKGPNNGDKEVVTLFRNRKPVSKITTRLGVSVIKKDFEKKVLEHYNNKGQLTKFQKPGLIEHYGADGKVTYKEQWIGDNHFVYINGKLSKKEIGVKGKQQYLVTEYDENEKVIKEFSRGVEEGIAIGNPDEQEWDLTEALFKYYKKKAK
ncbi:hypothetical protein [Pedobacter agri]|uniref:hypothetical protein n=1 Tax=Pedobacter agri TaxID=454586 RepID=UPI002931AF38|nr:hypothetical protein [Pedobacter agri]